MKKTTKRTVKKVGVQAPKKALFYKVIAKILGKNYEQIGETVSEALAKFDLRNIKGVRCILVVEHDGNKKERILQPMQANRLFNSHGLMREVHIKNVSTLFQGF